MPNLPTLLRTANAFVLYVVSVMTNPQGIIGKSKASKTFRGKFELCIHVIGVSPQWLFVV